MEKKIWNEIYYNFIYFSLFLIDEKCEKNEEC